MRTRVFRIIAVVIILGIFIFTGYRIMTVSGYQKKVAALSVSEVDVSKLSDGSYFGECDTGYVAAKVEVIVKDGKIDEVKLLEHKNERGQTAEIITGQIVEQQKIGVDTVTGATNSSKVIEQAVYQALSEK